MMVIGKLLDTLSNWLDLYSGHLYMATVVKVFHILSCQMSISRGQSHWHSLVRLPRSSLDCQLGDPSGALDLSRRKKICMVSLFPFSLHYGITIPLSYHCPPTLMWMTVFSVYLQSAGSSILCGLD